MVRITRQEYDNLADVDNIPNNIAAAVTMWSTGEHPTHKEKVEAAQTNHGLTFFQALFLQKLGQLPDTNQYPNWSQNWHQRLARVNDKDLRSLVIELIQNALDIEATNIQVQFEGDDCIRFSHTGKPWSIKELAAVDQFLSTKRGDISTIGQFGVGLKYWWHHFQNFEVLFYDGSGIHRLFYKHGFDPTECYYEYEEVHHEKENVTEFVFSSLLHAEDDTIRQGFEDYRDGEVQLLSGRVKDSMPNLMRNDQSDFSLSITTLNPSLTETYTIQHDRVFDPPNYEENGEQVSSVFGYWSKIISNAQDEVSVLSFKVRINQLSEQLSNAINQTELNENLQKFRLWVGQEYQQFSLEGSDQTNRTQRQIINEMFDKFVLSFHYNPSTERAFPSQMFVASDEATWPSVFTVDGPWKLTEDRLQLDNVRNPIAGNNHLCGVRRNVVLSKIGGFAFLKIIGSVLQNWQDIGINYTQIQEIVSGYQQKRSEHYHTEWTHINIARLKDEFQDEFSGTCNPSEALLLLWKDLADSGEEEALEWLSDAMHDDILSVNLSNRIRIPVVNSNADDSKVGSEICRTLSNGVPACIISWLNDNPGSGGLLARIGTKRNGATLLFLPQDAALFPIEFDSEDLESATIETYDKLERVCDGNEIEFNSAKYELRESDLGFQDEVIRPLINYVDQNLIKELEYNAFTISSECESDEHLDALLNQILENNLRGVDAGYIVVNLNGEGTFLLEIPSDGMSFALLIGDANAGKPYEIRLNKNDSQVTMFSQLNYWKWGEAILQLPFIHIHDETQDWWGELFAPDVILDGSDNDIPRATFGVEDLDGTGIDLSGGWRSFNTGFDDIQSKEFVKRMTPFVIKSISPENIGVHDAVGNLPDYALLKGLRVESEHGPMNQEGFIQLPPQINPVNRKINVNYNNPKLPPNMITLSLDITSEPEIRVKPVVLNNRVILKSESTIRPWAVTTINGPKIIVERKLEQIDDMSERLDYWRLWRQYLLCADNEGENINSNSFSDAYDLVFGSDGSNSEYRVYSKRIWRDVMGKRNPLNDDDSPRVSRSDNFQPLRANRMPPFYVPVRISTDLNSILLQNQFANYMPHTSSFEPLYAGYTFNFLEFKVDEVGKLNPNQNYPFARILPVLFEHLTSDNLEHNFAHLRVIQHLWEQRLFPEVFWNIPTLNRQRRILCRELIQQNDENLPEYISNEFVDFLSQQGVSHQENWNDFTSRLDRMTPEIWQEYLINLSADLMVPWQRFIGETYVTEFGTTLRNFLDRDSIEYFEEAIFANYLEADRSGKIIQFEEPVFVLSNSLAAKFREFAQLNINEGNLAEILFTDSIDSVDCDGAVNLAYLSPMIDHFRVDLSVQFKHIEETEFSNIGSEPIRFTLDPEGQNLTVYCSNEVTLTIHQHQWLMSCLRTRLTGLITEEHDYDQRFPWSWRDRNDADTLDAKLRFAQRYCEITTIEQLHPDGYEAIENLDQLENHLNQLIQLYRNKDAVLNQTVTLAYDHYIGMQTIRTNGLVIHGGMYDQKLESPVSIPSWMVGRMNEVGQSALGDTLLVGEFEAQFFRRFTENSENREAYDLAPDTAQILRDRLLSDGEEGWFGGQELDYLFTFENVFITSRQGVHANACLWRVHALHILAFLEAEQFRWGI